MAKGLPVALSNCSGKSMRPKAQGFFKELASSLLGIKPELKYKDIIMSSADRFGFETESTGVVEIEVGVITKDFGVHGVNLQPN